jgi:16S rRNA (cytosine967-C5)-methyltransferase
VTTSARLGAFHVLCTAEAPGATLAERLLDPEIDGLPARERAFLHELVLGTLRSRGSIDHALAALADRPLERLDPHVLTILRLGAHQILNLAVPDHAAVSESVALARGETPRAAGFVNAVLRRLARDGPAALPDPQTDPRAWLTTGGSLPPWLADRWLSGLGPERAVRRARALLAHPARVFRVNPRVKEALARVAPFDPRPRRVPGAFEAREALPKELAQEGVVYIQDEGSQLAAAVLPLSPPVWDACAAPGGKTTALADRLGGAGLVVATENSRSRLRTLARLVRRWGAGNVRLVCASALAPPLLVPQRAILLDAPCSGLGTLSRHPDIRWRARPEDLPRHAERQRALLESTAACLAPGGALVYATCSLEPEENEGVLGPFLDAHRDFRALPFPEWAESFRSGLFARALPEDTNGDGFFVGLLGRDT